MIVECLRVVSGAVARFPVVSRRVLVRVVLMGFKWRDTGEARRINVRFRRVVRF
jgi:hypothetical protein